MLTRPGAAGAAPLRAGLAALAAAAMALVLAACGGDTSGNDAQALGELRAGSVAQKATCDDWNSGTVDQKFATAADVREQLSTNRPKADTSALSDEEAFEIFESACSEEFTGSFLLYKMYFQALAYQSLVDPIPEE